MTNYALPSHTGIRSVTFRMVSANSITQSPFTFKQQVLQNPGRRWEVDITIPPTRLAENARPWLAWLAKLDGSLHTFNLGDPLGASPRGAGGGTPLVNGASQTGSSLVVDGCPVSEIGWLLEGDYIQLGSGVDARLYMVTSDVDTNGTGDAAIEVWPEIETAPSDNDPVVITNTVGTFRLASNVSTWSANEASVYGIQFSGVGVP